MVRRRVYALVIVSVRIANARNAEAQFGFGNLLESAEKCSFRAYAQGKNKKRFFNRWNKQKNAIKKYIKGQTNKKQRS